MSTDIIDKLYANYSILVDAKEDIAKVPNLTLDLVGNSG